MKIRKFLRNVAAMLLMAGILWSVLVVQNGYAMYRTALEAESLEEKQEQIQAKDGYTALAQMPEIYKKAVVSAEDRRFYRHPGIDPIAIARAVITDIRARALVEGGSTITQQLAKNLYFTQEKVFGRKVAEVFMAFALERAFTKEEILEMYVNTIYFGNGYDCAAQASLGYFGKEISGLNEEECVMLAGIPNAPSLYNPADHPTLAKERQRQVYELMKKAG